MRPLWLLLCAMLCLGGVWLHGADEGATTLTTDAPVINFRVPTFTPQGYRSWLLSGARGLYADPDKLVIADLNLTVFKGDASDHVESIFLSPSATAFLHEEQVKGPGFLRLITDDFEATGQNWSYDHRQKKISIRKNVHVVFHAPLKDILR